VEVLPMVKSCGVAYGGKNPANQKSKCSQIKDLFLHNYISSLYTVSLEAKISPYLHSSDPKKLKELRCRYEIKEKAAKNGMSVTMEGEIRSQKLLTQKTLPCKLPAQNPQGSSF
jgi:hypothetical protein